ncbi:M20/M25/M40 family metallo-hydrolase [Sulfobacillus thermotolerans]|uniref:M20/M25/M40 family metallo-hydrolase n=1 Tax=Sulfobacillus thermotolerans TaxID=338644 RepID=UPI003365BAAC
MGISGFAEMQRLQDHVMREFIEDFRGLLQVRCENPGADMTLAAEYVAAVAERLGYTVRIDHVPDSLAHQHHVRKAVNVLARIGPDADQAVILNAHFDTTPPGEGWSVDPYSGHLKDEVIYGRGAAVSKSDVMGYLYAVYMAYQMVRPSFPVFVMLTGDEETGGYLGPQRLLALGSWPAHTVAICPGSADVVVDRHGGALLWTIVLRGRSRHAAVSERGGDSVKAGAELITEFYQYREAQIPTICYGAGQANLFEMGAHGPDEHIAMADSSRAMLVLSTVVATLWRKGPTSLVDLALTAKGDEHD